MLVAAGDRIDPDRFNRFGFLTGAAFQIQDDVLNLVGDDRVYGKEIGGDLWEGKRTLVLSHALREASGKDGDRLRDLLGKPRQGRSPSDIAWMMDLLRRGGSIEYAQRSARELARAAVEELPVAFASARPGPDFHFIRDLVSYTTRRDSESPRVRHPRRAGRSGSDIPAGRGPRPAGSKYVGACSCLGYVARSLLPDGSLRDAGSSAQIGARLRRCP